jgi:hypothetical protein
MVVIVGMRFETMLFSSSKCIILLFIFRCRSGDAQTGFSIIFCSKALPFAISVSFVLYFLGYISHNIFYRHAAKRLLFFK